MRVEGGKGLVYHTPVVASRTDKAGAFFQPPL
jgi:hypothetical protein